MRRKIKRKLQLLDGTLNRDKFNEQSPTLLTRRCAHTSMLPTAGIGAFEYRPQYHVPWRPLAILRNCLSTNPVLPSVFVYGMVMFAAEALEKGIPCTMSNECMYPVIRNCLTGNATSPDLPSALRVQRPIQPLPARHPSTWLRETTCGKYVQPTT